MFYAWLLFNGDVAEHVRLNLAVPILGGLASLMIIRARPRIVTAVSQAPSKPILAKAA